jgi:hypothetical protein
MKLLHSFVFLYKLGAVNLISYIRIAKRRLKWIIANKPNRGRNV